MDQSQRTSHISILSCIRPLDPAQYDDVLNANTYICFVALLRRKGSCLTRRKKTWSCATYARSECLLEDEICIVLFECKSSGVIYNWDNYLESNKGGTYWTSVELVFKFGEFQGMEVYAWGYRSKKLFSNKTRF